MKRNIKSALKSSLEKEEKSVVARFEKAEAAFSEKAPKSKTKNEKTPPMTEKVVRDTFTIPESDYKLIKEVKLRCLRAGVEVSKSELVRAGIKLLFEIPEDQLLATVNRLERLKVGRKSMKS